MVVTTINGESVAGSRSASIAPSQVREAEVMTSQGKSLQVKSHLEAIGESPTKFYLWGLGGMFALLGWAVVLRRPDLRAARLFGLFAGISALALAVGPASGGPAPEWAVAMQALTLVGIGGVLLPFVCSLVGNARDQRYPLWLVAFVGLGLLIGLGYGVSVLYRPAIYEWLRPVLMLYVAASACGAVAMLALKVSRETSPGPRQQARISLLGIALGILPFVVLTLIPEAMGRGSLAPVPITVLAVGLVPASFAYAILQHQLLGIRRLVHRGMVYGIASIATLVVIAVALSVVTSLLGVAPEGGYPISLTASILAVGVVLFFPLHQGARWLVDKLVYHDVVDYRRLMDAVRGDLLTSRQTRDVAAGVAQSLAQVLRLESVLLFLGSSPSEARIVAAVGERSEEVLRKIYPQFQLNMPETKNRELVELYWESDSLLLASLTLPSRYVGFLLLGPKRSGEVFLPDEKQLVTTIAPILSLAIDKSELSEELRELNLRLFQAGEAERARIASDIHDGPLQKAILLAGIGGNSVVDPNEVARQLTSDLREICSRLRPAILDDLGVVPALEWLLDEVEGRYSLSTQLSLDGVEDDNRFAPEVELALFRVTQEAANNAVKHAMGTRLDVWLSRENGYLVLQVTDNGRGFSPASSHKGGLGLSGMHQRVTQLKGTFDIQSAPGAGTKVIARIPV